MHLCYKQEKHLKNTILPLSYFLSSAPSGNHLIYKMNLYFTMWLVLQIIDHKTTLFCIHQPVAKIITATLVSPAESNGQLLSINGKTEDDILQSLERALVIMKTASERKVFFLDSILYLTRVVSNVICGKYLLYPIFIVEMIYIRKWH